MYIGDKLSRNYNKTTLNDSKWVIFFYVDLVFLNLILAVFSCSFIPTEIDYYLPNIHSYYNAATSLKYTLSLFLFYTMVSQQTRLWHIESKSWYAHMLCTSGVCHMLFCLYSVLLCIVFHYRFLSRMGCSTLCIHFIQLRVKDLAQRPSNGSWVVLGFEFTTLQLFDMWP